MIQEATMCEHYGHHEDDNKKHDPRKSIAEFWEDTPRERDRRVSEEFWETD